MNVLLRVAIGFLLVISSLPLVSGATAQESYNRVTSSLTQKVVEIDASQEATIEHEDTVLENLGNGEQLEIIYITTPFGDAGISFYTGGATPESIVEYNLTEAPGWYDDYVDFFGSGSTSESGWFLFRGAFQNNFFDYSYAEIYQADEPGTVIEMFLYAPDPEATISLIEWIQDYLTIDGGHVYSSTDIPAIKAMLDGSSQNEPERVYGFSSELADWKDQGLVSDTHWKSPNWDTDVEWDDTNLYFPTHRGDAIEFEPEINGDYLYLYSQNPDGQIYINFVDPVDRPADMTMLDFYENRYTSEEWLTERDYNFPAHASSQSETSVSAIYSYTDHFGVDRVILRTVWETPGGMLALIDVTNHPELIADTYMNVVSSLTIDGEPLEAHWTYEELAELFPPATDVAEAENPANSDLRSVSDGHHIWNPED